MLSGLAGGAILGYLYYYYIGCASGTCAITSNPYISTSYGAMIGLIFVWPKKHKNTGANNDDDAKTL